MPELRTLMWLAAICVAGFGCSDDDSKANPSDVFAGQSGSGGGSSASALCEDYCQVIVDEGDGCEHYNDASRCESICGYYMASACVDTYETFVECMRDTKAAACILPDGGEKLALVVNGCNSQFEAWMQCREEKDVSVCPY